MVEEKKYTVVSRESPVKSQRLSGVKKLVLSILSDRLSIFSCGLIDPINFSLVSTWRRVSLAVLADEVEGAKSFKKDINSDMVLIYSGNILTSNFISLRMCLIA